MNKLSFSAINYIMVAFAFLVLLFHFHQLSFFLTHAITFTDLGSEVAVNNESVNPSFVDDNKQSLSLLFLGDVMLGRHVEYLSSVYGVGYSTEFLKDNLPLANATVANFESAMAIPHIRTPSFVTQFSTSEVLLPVLTDLGITHVSLANNHTLDYGIVGYQNAVAKLQKSSITPFGHPQSISSSSVTVVGSNVRVGIIGLNLIFTNPNIDDIKKELEYLKLVSDVQVAYIHWGEEYMAVHNLQQEQFARELIMLGVDAIVGHHPHVAQDIDVIDGVPVFYSLGNFIFDQYFSKEVQEGYALQMNVNEDDDLQFLIIPVTSIDSHSQTRLMTRFESAKFLETLASNSNEQLRDAILANTLQSKSNLAYEEEMSMITQ